MKMPDNDICNYLIDSTLRLALSGKMIPDGYINVTLPESIINKGDMHWLAGSDGNMAAMPEK